MTAPRIIGVQVLAFHRQLDGRAWNPTFRWHERRAPLVVVHTDTGAVGVGEGWSAPSDPAPVLAALATLAPSLIGRDVQAVLDDLHADTQAALTVPHASALSAVDMACHDAQARSQGLPLWRFLGGSTGQARVYASGGLYRDDGDEAALAAEMTGYLAQGHRAVKMKIGALSMAEDLARVRAVRAAIGPEAVLWADAVNQWCLPGALEGCDALREMGVSALQAPVPFDDVAGMARIQAHGLPVVATEAEHRPAVFAALLDARAVGYLQFCLGLCGGFAGAARLDDLARTYGVQSTPQTYSTAVMQAATLHFAAARGNVVRAEWHGFHDHLRALMPAPMTRVQDGVITLGDEPGLGIAVPQPGQYADGSQIDLYHSCGHAS